MKKIFNFIKEILNKNTLLKDIIETLFMTFVIVFVLLKFFIFPCQVDGSSMYPTLIHGDTGFSFVLTKNLGVNRFDIVVVNTYEENNKRLVKRVIGLPNETIEYKDNILYVDGIKINEDFLHDTYTENFIVTLGDDEYYCLGDNRTNSRDSRHYGAFNYEQFESTHLFVIYPFADIGFKS